MDLLKFELITIYKSTGGVSSKEGKCRCGPGLQSKLQQTRTEEEEVMVEEAMPALTRCARRQIRKCHHFPLTDHIELPD